MEIRSLKQEEIAEALGLARFVYREQLEQSVEDEQAVRAFYESTDDAVVREAVSDGRLLMRGMFFKGELLAVSAMTDQAHLTMLYVLPQYQRRGFGKEMIGDLRYCAYENGKRERLTVNVMPAWMSGYFARRKFRYTVVGAGQTLSYVPMERETQKLPRYRKRRIDPGVILGLSLASLGAVCAILIACMSRLFFF